VTGCWTATWARRKFESEARILPAKLGFKWGRDVPTLVLVADGDVCLPINGMYEIFERIPAAKRMIVLRRADHMHFMDNVEQLHETVRTSPPWILELDCARSQNSSGPVRTIATSVRRKDH
jgi:pimeloyl-ACP methyl ester carboxylesterase